ncbi:hypothetical protein SARC_05246 [Sphaeroforma arctica JP610]|uniref:Ribosomal RNA large subunit methyltransferase K/L-like methyltransferase domain-containing protein n=1 Tax=Sphaeroforma arctica JP610 TaxID=667725 RepID=A0A0L0G0W9_9EUKA|nr:hypothetical protein SARC_05246 [Sphaeroforma arctica JP610]KNC82476.1 hypothetical protein SARC_05246 [Sphaeroforma arctica JP610]|eukprot:XP_014156378.1 hypothetical protein SARC_05246 [Sphaeroforma arctica JP610]
MSSAIHAFTVYWRNYYCATLISEQVYMNPEVVLVHLEDHSLDIKQANLKAQGVAGINLDERQPFCVYIGRRITKSSRDLIQKYRLPDRAYIHTTSMSAELSFISANMAWARPGTLMMDPFAGTGSFLVACAEFGAQTLGSDIDPRVIRGTCGIGEGTVDDNFRQYGTTANYLGLNIMDFSNLPLRKQEWLDSIICDPPYGFREGARKVRIGRLRCGEDNKYPLSSLLLDLLEFAAQHLVVGGRLVYWLPMMREEFSVERIPLHPSMRLVAHASDSMKLGAARYLITMHKIAPYTPGQLEPTEEQEKVFNNYREKMFKEGEWADEDKPAPKPRRKGDARKET